MDLDLDSGFKINDVISNFFSIQSEIQVMEDSDIKYSNPNLTHQI